MLDEAIQDGSIHFHLVLQVGKHKNPVTLYTPKKPYQPHSNRSHTTHQAHTVVTRHIMVTDGYQCPESILNRYDIIIMKALMDTICILANIMNANNLIYSHIDTHSEEAMADT